MVYILPDEVNDTTFPKATDKDLKTACHFIRRKYIRLYTLIKFYSLLYNPTVASHDDPDIHGDSTTNPPGTVVDKTYGETVPSAMQADGWFQPHGTSPKSIAADATEGKKYDDFKEIRAQVTTELTTKQLERWGLNEERDATIFFAAPLLDDATTTVKTGDKFRWDGEEFEITEVYRRGRWKHTNVYLYIVCQAKRIKLGS